MCKQPQRKHFITLTAVDRQNSALGASRVSANPKPPQIVLSSTPADYSYQSSNIQSNIATYFHLFKNHWEHIYVHLTFNGINLTLPKLFTM
jgi:hypothetical protein